MSQMFDNYIKARITVPDNRKLPLNEREEFYDSIVIGGTNEHWFKIPHSYVEIDDLIVTYRQGTEIILSKIKSEVEFPVLLMEDHSCSFYYTLSSEESALFNEYNTDTWVQVKLLIHYEGDESESPKQTVEFSPKYKLKLIGTIPNEREN